MNSDGIVDVDKSIQDIPENTKHKKEDIINATKECASISKAVFSLLKKHSLSPIYLMCISLSITEADNDCNTTYRILMCIREKLK